jgi:hypothetical protein
MNVAIAIDRLRPGAEYRRCGTYQELVDTWEDETPVPSLAELQVAYDEYLVEQQAEAQRQAALEQVRAANATPLNVSDYSGQTTLIQTLAQKISWLEQEIRGLRGLD